VAAACSSSPPQPTPIPPTLTPLEQEEETHMRAWEDGGRSTNWLARQGVRVIHPHGEDLGDSMALPDCSPAFPVAGTEYGLYYLPSDELYEGFNRIIHTDLCFTSEDDAIRAGYRRAPHGVR
jgi:hypothetical protein